MGMRMLEVMYIAKLMQLNAFDQPNVELYKQKTRGILGI
jgi:glucose-6-phosphate isomerase